MVLNAPLCRVPEPLLKCGKFARKCGTIFPLPSCREVGYSGNYAVKLLSDVKGNKLSTSSDGERASHSTERYGRALARFFKYDDVEVRAMLLLANMYYEGIGVPQDLVKAVAYLQKLVDYEDIRRSEEGVRALGLFFLGELYYRGFVVPKDDSLAEKYWHQGAWSRKDPLTDSHYLGCVKCRTALGMFYSRPNGGNVKKAFRWHKRAQEAGSIVSEGALGVMYMNGFGTQKNMELAYRHLINAAVQDNIYAKGYLTVFYYKHKMFSRTVQMGRELAAVEDYDTLAKSNDCPLDHIKRGVSVGCYYLALCLQAGLSVDKDIDLAKSLIKKASIS